MNKAIQQAIELAREGKNQEAYALIEQELKLHPGNGLAWAIRAQLTDNREDRLESLEQALELAPNVLAHAWIRREIELAEAGLPGQRVVDPFPGDPVPSPHALDIAFLDDDTDRSLKTQAMPVAEQKPRWRGCLNLLIAAVVLVIVALAASVFLVPALRDLLPF